MLRGFWTGLAGTWGCDGKCGMLGNLASRSWPVRCDGDLFKFGHVGYPRRHSSGSMSNVRASVMLAKYGLFSNVL